MRSKISVVINTLNEEENIKRAIKSLGFADEIIVCDMHSADNTVKAAKELGAKIFFHKKEEFVEPARNYAISKASNEWILLIDPDEEIPQTLSERLQEIAESMKQIDYVKIPRKNVIFGHFMKASMWWPDFNVRFFRKGKVNWTDKIHQPPVVSGMGIDLDPIEKYAVIHNHYKSLTEFLEKVMRYTKIQAGELLKDGYKFDWRDLIKKPFSEFLGRFFANRGYEDGLHGLVLALLQAFSFLLVYLRIWEIQGFKSQTFNLQELQEVNKESEKEIEYWFKNAALSGNSFKRFFQKVRNKF